MSSSAYSRSPPTGSPLASRDTPRGELAGHQHGRGLPLDGGIRADDGLTDDPGVNAIEELAQAELLPPDAVERTQRATEDVVAALEPRALDGDDVAGILDHADDLGIAPVVAADGALLARLRHVEADRAERRALLDGDDGFGQTAGVVGRHLQNVKGDALGRLGPDAGQATEFVDQGTERAGVHLVGHLAGAGEGL